MIVLLAQFGMAFQQTAALLSFLNGNLVLNQWFNGNYIYFQNVLNFTGPISLLIVGKQIRKDYLNFMFGRKKQITKVTIIFSTSPKKQLNAFKK